jgi:hypothetical protein
MSAINQIKWQNYKKLPYHRQIAKPQSLYIEKHLLAGTSREKGHALHKLKEHGI